MEGKAYIMATDMKKILYHITPIENKESIQRDGLIPKDGKVFLFEDVDIPYPEGLFRTDKWSNNKRMIPVSDIIAKVELHIKEYALFKVEVDTDTLFADNDCGEKEVMDYQYYTCQPINDVEYVGDFEIGKWYDYELLKEKYHIPAGYKVICFGDNWGFGIAPNGFRL